VVHLSFACAAKVSKAIPVSTPHALAVEIGGLHVQALGGRPARKRGAPRSDRAANGGQRCARVRPAEDIHEPIALFDGLSQLQAQMLDACGPLIARGRMRL
jgi:hypothetical protein